MHDSILRRRTLRLLGAACLALARGGAARAQASAQTSAQTSAEAVYGYRGADRDARLVDKARQEGSVSVYTSLATKESGPLAQAFEKKYRIKVDMWRSTSDKVVQRVLTEGQAHRRAVDVVETNGPEMEMIAREKLLAPFFSPHLADLPPAVLPGSRLWAPDRLNFFVVAYNTRKYKRADLPRDYEGFLDPKWKGQLGIEATDVEWMAGVVHRLGSERGMKLFERLAAMRPDVRKGHVLLAELVAAGEVPVGLTVYNAEVESLKRRGAPVDWLPVEPVIGRPQGIGLLKDAPHPHAALLFADFVLSPEGQALFAAMGRVPASTRVKTELANFPYTMLDPATVIDEGPKWEALWDRMFLNK